MNKKVLKRRVRFIVDPIKKYFFKPNHKRVNVYAKYYDELKINKNTILYESRDGNSITDNPYAIFKYMINRPEYNNYTHIWSVQDFDALEPVISKYKNHSNVKFVKRNSRAYLKCLASCEYLINNSTFQSFYTPKEGQIYINTWHGTPLKHMGFDIPGNPAQNQNVLRNFLSADYILSPNQHTTKVYTESYKLNGLFEGKIIEAGYPRIDLIYNMDREEQIKDLQSYGIKLDTSKKNILYAPTWKGTNVSKANDDVSQIISDMADLEKRVGEQYNILVKVHPFLYKTAEKYENFKDKLIPDFVDANELLSVVDLLITDYSSIFFDFLVTDKPILFYTWDADVYSEERGQYFDYEELPGKIVYNCQELIESVENIESIHKEYNKNYQTMKEKFTSYDDGNVTERIVRHLFQNSNEKLKTITCINPQKEKIIIYPGGMRDNGITSSFLNLMNNIDYDKFDVTCFTQTPKSLEVLKNIGKVNKNVRFLFKPGLPVYRFKEIFIDKFVHNRGARGLGKKIYPEKAYKREQRRLFGKTHFDYAIDFSGYSLFWAKFLLATDAKRKICFMHNDLLSDSERTVKGRKPHRINLRGLFSVYHRFDKLVSVSKGTMELNKKNLIQYADESKFGYVLNTINPEKILQNNIETESKSDKNTEVETSYFKSNAILRNIKDYPVWNTLPGNINAGTFALGDRFENAEILIVRMATIDDKVLYKFKYNHQSIGWIDSRAVELVDDSILNEETVDKVGIISRYKGNSIWTKPYKLPEIQKVSGGYDYRWIMVKIDKIAQTLHGKYCRITINDTVIGWIDNRALKIYNRLTIDEHDNYLSKLQKKLIRKLMFTRNYLKNKGFIKNLENRTLEEVNFDGKFIAKIVNADEHIIWSKAYPNYNVKEKGYAKDYLGDTALIKKIHKTKAGEFYNFEIEGKISGWLKAEAFSEMEQQNVISEKEIKVVAELKDFNETVLWTQPKGVEGATELMIDMSKIKDKRLIVDKEVETTDGTFCHVNTDEKELGWINKELLTYKETLGILVEGRFIPYPERNYLNFVNMGRLSPEKAQGNLIQAFAKFHKNHPNSRLYILGKGPLKDELQSLINKLELNDYVFLMGQLENPFPFMKQCDCFVLSSHYEGQPMVLLEAMTLGMKILATDIVANRTVLEDGKYGVLVEDSIDGLEKGLHYMANNPTYKPQKFDYTNYNKQAMQTFLKALKG